MASVEQFSCSDCIFSTNIFSKLLRHYRHCHVNEVGFAITCRIDGCHKIYKNTRSYTIHIRKCHLQFWNTHLGLQKKSVASSRPNEDKEMAGVQSSCTDDIVLDMNDSADYDDTDLITYTDFSKKVASFLLQLREKFFVQGSACSFAALEIKDIVKLYRESLLSKGNITGNPEMVSSLENTELEDAFQLFSDNRKLNSYIAEKFGYVEPVEYVLGKNIKGKDETMQYVPILETLAALLKHDDVVTEVLAGHKSFDGKIRDYCDTASYNSSSLFNCDSRSLQIQLYCDDFCVANPLGNKVKKLKLCAFYFTLGYLLPKLRSKLHTIQLVTLCPTYLTKKYSLHEVLKPLLKDLRKLEEEGICIIKDGTNPGIILRGTVTFLSGDNLASHGVGGFLESFTVQRVCRFCHVTRPELQNVVRYNQCSRRTELSYDAQIKTVEKDSSLASIYGIKKNSPLNDLQYFHVTRGLPPDIAHDLFIGIVPDMIEKVVHHLVSQDCFTLEYLNQRIETFDYDAEDKPNKPSTMPVTLSKFRVKQTASQSWCLLRLLPLLVGPLIPHDDPQWMLLLNLMDVVEHCCMPVVTVPSTELLADIIESFHERFKKEYPNDTLKPKMHYLVHYPQQLNEFGPLVNCWTLRFESKHGYFKDVTYRLKNKKNICKTLAVRHEFYQAMFRSRPNFLGGENVNASGGSMIQIS